MNWKPQWPTPDSIEYDETGYPLETYLPINKDDAPGGFGAHGPIGFYARTKEQNDIWWPKHLETCNQCRKFEGLPFNPEGCHFVWKD